MCEENKVVSLLYLSTQTKKNSSRLDFLFHENYAVEQMYRDESIHGEMYVLMTDRILMNEGKPQIYGTQYYRQKLYRIDDMDSVQVRRQQIGLPALSTD